MPTRMPQKRSLFRRVMEAGIRERKPWRPSERRKVLLGGKQGQTPEMLRHAAIVRAARIRAQRNLHPTAAEEATAWAGVRPREQSLVEFDRASRAATKIKNQRVGQTESILASRRRKARIKFVYRKVRNRLMPRQQ